MGYKYVGCGGDFARPRRDFTRLITTCCLLSLLLLIPLLLWLLSGSATSLPYDCESGFAQWETTWSSAHRASGAGRSVQLRRWFRKLAGRLVSAKEGVVLQSPRQGLPEPRRRLRDVIQAVRLQCWFRQLDGGLVCGQEGLVLQQ